MNEGGQRIMEANDFNAIRGANGRDFWPSEGQANAWPAIETAKGGGAARFEGFANTMKGTCKRWDVEATLIPGADGRREKLLAVSRDITEQKRIEGELRELNETLERRIEERTANCGHPKTNCASRKSLKLSANSRVVWRTTSIPSHGHQRQPGNPPDAPRPRAIHRRRAIYLGGSGGRDAGLQR